MLAVEIKLKINPEDLVTRAQISLRQYCEDKGIDREFTDSEVKFMVTSFLESNFKVSMNKLAENELDRFIDGTGHSEFGRACMSSLK